MRTHHLSRRLFIRNTSLTLGALGLSGRALAAGKPLPVALQLYSVRNDCGKDFDATLARVAELGFDGVEFAGYYQYGDNAVGLRKKLDDLGLKAAATHIGTGSFRGDALERTIEFHNTLGCKYLIVPGDGDFTKPDKCKALADLFNETAAALKPLGMKCGYHNHTHEFTEHEGKTYWDWFAERTTKDVVLQQDCGWTAAAGLDPVAMMEKYPGRMGSTHFKPTVVGNEAGKKPILGQDSVDWAAVLKACMSVGGTEWVTLEQERYPDGKSPMECSALSFAALKKLQGRG
jgi:sugar phosphate isomerase/epimerase